MTDMDRLKLALLRTQAEVLRLIVKVKDLEEKADRADHSKSDNPESPAA